MIELKHWTGCIAVRPHNWVINETNYRPDPHKINSFKGKIVKGIYQHRFKTYPNIWVESVVVMTNPEVEIVGADSPGVAAEKGLNNPTFASVGDLITYLKKRRAVLNRKILNDQQINTVISYFAELKQPKQTIRYNVPGYETIEYISQRPECIELIARPLQGFGKGCIVFVFSGLFQTRLNKKRNDLLKELTTQLSLYRK